MKDFFVGLFSPTIIALIIVVSVVVPYYWPPVWSLVLNSLFWSAVSLLLVSSVIVVYLYLHGGTTQNAHFALAMMLIISASFMYASFEQIAENTAFWAQHMSAERPLLFAFLTVFISNVKNMVAFGFAAIGASVAANVISNRFAKRQSA